MKYVILYKYILRISRVTGEGSLFCKSCLTIVQRMVTQGAKKPNIFKYNNKYIHDFQHITSELSIT